MAPNALGAWPRFQHHNDDANGQKQCCSCTRAACMARTSIVGAVCVAVGVSPALRPPMPLWLLRPGHSPVLLYFKPFLPLLARCSPSVNLHGSTAGVTARFSCHAHIALAGEPTVPGSVLQHHRRVSPGTATTILLVDCTDDFNFVQPAVTLLDARVGL